LHVLGVPALASLDFKAITIAELLGTPVSGNACPGPALRFTSFFLRLKALLDVPAPVLSSLPAFVHFSFLSSHLAVAVSVVTVGPPALELLSDLAHFSLDFSGSFLLGFLDLAQSIASETGNSSGNVILDGGEGGGCEEGKGERFHDLVVLDSKRIKL